MLAHAMQMSRLSSPLSAERGSRCISRVVAFTPRRQRGLARPKLRRWSSRASAAGLPDAAETFLAAALTSSPGLKVGVAANSLVYLLGIKVLLKGLRWEGIFSSWFLGTVSYAAFGPGGYLLVCLYFVVGSLVTKLKLEQKQKEGIAEARSGRRGLGSVLGSGAAGMACATLALAPFGAGIAPLLRAGFVASFASKLADTASSEIGKAYGRTTYLITTLERVPRGTEGAVSLEGTIAGAVAAAGMAGIALGLGQVSLRGASCVVVAAVIANTVESWVGAALQGRPGLEWLNNDAVNVLQISLAAGLTVGLLAASGWS
jgi:uncharacterized protein (TIGR00297 family)